MDLSQAEAVIDLIHATNEQAVKNSARQLNGNLCKKIKELRESVGMNRKEFSEHTGIPVRTLEDWEVARRTPPEYIPRLIEYQFKYEKKMDRGIDDMEAGRELPWDEAFQKIRELRENTPIQTK